ncbi:A1 cistron-splicing factor AAR2 [Cryptococcus neoformans Tu401-1]|nr:A1 cistron-splicing factor AAR2 [Cryptococcus neoformans var. grubii Tu401-1]
MDQLNAEQAQALWEAGGFLIITDLPEGSEFGIDGTFHTVRKFSGIKFLPPGFHFIAWSPPSSSTAGPSVIQIRQAFVRNFSTKERYAVHYNKDTENVSLPENDITMSDDNLKTLDKELAPYPFERFEAWKSLTSHITPTISQTVIGPDGKADGLMPVIDQEEDTLTTDMREKLEEIKRRSQNFGFTKSLMFVRFSLKKSWRDGAVGEEVTVYSKDKSWLLGNVIDEQLDRNPTALLGHLQLSFVLFLQLSSYSSFLAYKRILALLCQSSSFLISPSSFLSPPKQNPNAHVGEGMKILYKELLKSLRVEIEALPDGVFDTELPEMDVFYLDQLESLRRNLASAIWGEVEEGTAWTDLERQSFKSLWNALRDSAWKKWMWDIDELSHRVDEEDEDEEGEYAPVVVEM